MGNTNFPNGINPATLAIADVAVTASAATLNAAGYRRSGRKQATVSADKTLAITDVGTVQVVDTDAKIITLPSTVVGYTFVVENGGADGAVLVSVSPAAADKIMGGGFTAADNKDALNTKLTAKLGDRIVLVGDGVDGWYVQEMVGTWAREA